VNLAELIAGVYTVTNRSDMVAETLLAVKSATLTAHHSDFYPKDLFEVGIQWNPIAYQQSLEYRTIIARWRSFKYLRKVAYTATSTTPGKLFKMITPSQSLDSYGIEQENICYLAGEVINIRSDTKDTYMLLGCYLHPDLSDTTFTSWVALDHPYAIIFGAAALIFKSIGWDEQSAQANQTMMQQLALIRLSNIQAEGY